MENEKMTQVVGELKYNRHDFIGEGNFGAVFKGVYSLRPVAIKRIQRKYGKEKSAIQEREVELMKIVDHPNILRVIHTEMNLDFLFIVTELCRGTLQEYVEGIYKGPKFMNVRDILVQITQGLAHLHEKNIVHRDIKPTNILIFIPSWNTSKPVMKLADFGISKMLKADKKDFSNTSVTNPRGTRGWMPPEVYKQERYDFKVDVWALGLIFAYTLSGGKHPFGEDIDTRIDLIRKENDMLMVPDDVVGSHWWDSQAFRLVKFLLKPDPSKRPTVEDVLKHPFYLLCYWDIKNYYKKLWTSFKDSLTCEQKVQLAEMLRENGLFSEIHFSEFDNRLHILCRYYKNDNLIDLLTLSIEKGADVNEENEKGETPLHSLCQYYKSANLIYIIQLLIRQGAKVNSKCRNGWTPLHFLCRYYQNNNLIDIIRQLAENGADVNSKATDGWTPLIVLCQSYQNDNLIDIIRQLVENGADVNSKNKDGWTSLHILCYNYQNDNLIDIIRQLVKMGADVNSKQPYGWTPLHFLCQNYQNYNLMEIVKLLIENGAEVNAIDGDGYTPLHCLCLMCKKDNLIEIIQLLIGKGGSVTVKNKSGSTPLHILCRCYKNETASKEADNLKSLVGLFENHGARMDAKNNEGKTPNDYLVDRKKTIAVDGPIKDNNTKNEDTTVNCITTERLTAVKSTEALPQKSLLSPSTSSALDEVFIRPETRKRKRIYNMNDKNSAQLPNAVRRRY